MFACALYYPEPVQQFYSNNKMTLAKQPNPRAIQPTKESNCRRRSAKESASNTQQQKKNNTHTFFQWNLLLRENKIISGLRIWDFFFVVRQNLPLLVPSISLLQFTIKSSLKPMLQQTNNRSNKFVGNHNLTTILCCDVKNPEFSVGLCGFYVLMCVII